jgi:hypothetical protein
MGCKIRRSGGSFWICLDSHLMLDPADMPIHRQKWGSSAIELDYPSVTVGRVEDWRADFRLRWVFHRFRGGPQSGCHDHVSSPRRIERSVRVSRTTLTCLLRATVYGTYSTETTFRRSRRNR